MTSGLRGVTSGSSGDPVRSGSGGGWRIGGEQDMVPHGGEDERERELDEQEIGEQELLSVSRRVHEEDGAAVGFDPAPETGSSEMHAEQDPRPRYAGAGIHAGPQGTREAVGHHGTEDPLPSHSRFESSREQVDRVGFAVATEGDSEVATGSGDSPEPGVNPNPALYSDSALRASAASHCSDDAPPTPVPRARRGLPQPQGDPVSGTGAAPPLTETQQRLLSMPRFRKKAAEDARRRRVELEEKAARDRRRKLRWERAAQRVRSAGLATPAERRRAVAAVLAQMESEDGECAAPSGSGTADEELPAEVRMLHPAHERGDIVVDLRGAANRFRSREPATFSGVPRGIGSVAAASDLRGSLSRSVAARRRGAAAAELEDPPGHPRGAAHLAEPLAADLLATPGLLSAAESIEQLVARAGASLPSAKELYRKQLESVQRCDGCNRQASVARGKVLSIPSGSRPYAQLAPVGGVACGFGRGGKIGAGAEAGVLR